MNSRRQLLVVRLAEQSIALHLAAVERAVRIVEVTPLPKAPGIVSGVVNVQGRIIPVINIRKRFRLPEREVALSDQLIVAHTSARAVALVVDAVDGVVEYPEEEIIACDAIVPGMEYVAGVVKLKDGVTLIHDLDTFLSLEEARSLDEAMESA